MARIIEIVGIAGSGKSTLTRMIKERNPGWCTDYRLPKMKTMLTQIGALLIHAAPVLLYSERGWIRRNLRILIHMNAIVESLKYEEKEKVIFFDQGVIFEYASLFNIGLKNAPIEYRDYVKEKILKRFLELLDVVVFLYAEKEILYERVVSRNSDHRLKNMSKSETIKFFLGYEKVYNEIKYLANQFKEIDVLEMNTKRQTVPESYEILLRKCIGE